MIRDIWNLLIKSIKICGGDRMECIKCKANMFKATLAGGVHGISVYLKNKKKGLFESERQSTVSCFVCSQCGYVELHADDPQKINISIE